MNPEERSTVTTQPASVPLVSTIFCMTYLALAFGKIPGLRIDRAGIALVGAVAMMACGVLSMQDAANAVDYETIVLLFGMMVVVAYLRFAGFFSLATDWIAASFSGPYVLLAVTIALSGVLSAFLVNDVVCVALTPLVLQLCQRLKRPPIPYLVGLATASNVGSVATITGNPQNNIIGSLSQIPYLRFAYRLAPVAAIGLVLTYLVVALVYKKSLDEAGEGSAEDLPEPRVHRGLLVKSVAVALVTVGLFFAGFPIALVALGAAGVLMFGRVRPEKVYDSVDWPLLVMFAGLFVVVHAFEAVVVQTWGIDRWHSLLDSPVVMVSGLSVVLSNLVSNVPAVLLFKPLMQAMAEANREQAWLALAMSSTLAGNLTVLGSVANLIVVENARRAGTELGFVEYLKVGIPLTILTTLVGVAWLALTHY
jgi:Na+/H+ antiporter NhaD/arsenite permease-like protein